MNWAPHKGYGHARDLTFVAPTNASIGPKETHCHQTQSYNAYALSGGGAVAVDTSQVQTDIPYGDYFRVETRWEVVGPGCLLGKDLTSNMSSRLGPSQTRWGAGVGASWVRE